MRRGQCGQRPTSIGRVLYVERLTAGSTAAARKCLLITRKIIIPPADNGDPPDGPPVFCGKKSFPPDSWDPPATSSHARKCVHIMKNKIPPDCCDPPTTSSHARKCVHIMSKKMIHPLTAGTHLGGRLTCGPTKLTGMEGFVNLVGPQVSLPPRWVPASRGYSFFVRNKEALSVGPS